MATYKGTINDALITGTHSDFPEVLDLSQMPASFWSTVKADGGDIRVYEDSGLTTEIPREIYLIDTGNQTGFIFVKHSSISSGNIIYLDVDGTRNNYAASDPFGSQNVWNNNYALVIHDPSTGNDSTSNGNNGTPNNISQIAGKVGNAGRFNGSSSYLEISSSNSLDSQNITIQFYGRLTAAPTDGDHYFERWSGDNKQALVRIDTSGGNRRSEFFIRQQDNNNEDNLLSTSSPSLDTWVLHHYQYDDNSGKSIFFDDGAADASDSVNNGVHTSITNPLIFGANEGTSSFLEGDLDEIRWVLTALSDDWISTEENNLSDPANFRTWEELVTGKRRAGFNVFF